MLQLFPPELFNSSKLKSQLNIYLYNYFYDYIFNFHKIFYKCKTTLLTICSPFHVCRLVH